MDAVRCHVGEEALLKAVLHAAKHHSQPVAGLLVGRERYAEPRQSAEGGEAGKREVESVTVVDAVPLSHTPLTAPVVQMGLMLVDKALAAVQQQREEEEEKGRESGSKVVEEEDDDDAALEAELAQRMGRLMVVGCYGANALYSDREPVIALDRIIEQLAGVESPILMQVVNTDLEKTNRLPISVRSTRNSRRGVDLDNSAEHISVLNSRIDACLQAGIEQEMVDYDEHLDDVSRDFLRNRAVSQALQRIARA